MALYHDQIDDFVVSTLDRWINKKQWADISLPFQKYTFVQHFMRGKVMEDGGAYLKWPVQVANTGTFVDRGLYHTDTHNVVNLLKNAVVEWSMQGANFSYDVDEEAFQSGYLATVRYLEARQHAMYNDYFAGMEDRLWSAPTDSAQDPRRPYGIPFWLQQNASEGFNGGNPSGFSSGAGGISSSTYPTWANWTFAYAAVNRDDIIAKLLKAIEFTHFKAPHAYNALADGPPKYGYFTTYRLKAQLDALLEGRNDNLGADLAWAADKAMIKSNPITWVPSLEHSTSANYAANNPIYGVNFTQFQYFVKSGMNMRVSKPKEAPTQHTVRNCYLDHACNFRCLNRREAGFVGYDSTL